MFDRERTRKGRNKINICLTGKPRPVGRELHNGKMEKEPNKHKLRLFQKISICGKGRSSHRPWTGLSREQALLYIFHVIAKWS